MRDPARHVAHGWPDLDVIGDTLSQLSYGDPVGDQARCVACGAFWAEGRTEHEAECHIGAAEDALRRQSDLLGLIANDTTAADLAQEVEFLKAEKAALSVPPAPGATSVRVPAVATEEAQSSSQLSHNEAGGASDE